MVESASENDFVQPAFFKDQHALLAPGSSTPIVWVVHKGNRESSEHQFPIDNEQVELYSIDLFIAESFEDRVMNIMGMTAPQ